MRSEVSIMTNHGIPSKNPLLQINPPPLKSPEFNTKSPTTHAITLSTTRTVSGGFAPELIVTQHIAAQRDIVIGCQQVR